MSRRVKSMFLITLVCMRVLCREAEILLKDAQLRRTRQSEVQIQKLKPIVKVQTKCEVISEVKVG